MSICTKCQMEKLQVERYQIETGRYTQKLKTIKTSNLPLNMLC